MSEKDQIRPDKLRDGNRNEKKKHVERQRQTWGHEGPLLSILPTDRLKYHLLDE